MKKLLQHNQQLFPKNLAIIGETGCGKTVLLQSLLESSLQQDTKVIAVDWEWIDRASELGLWAEKRNNVYQHLATASLDQIPSSATTLIFGIENGLTSNKIKAQGLIACRYTLSQSANLSQTIFCINEVDPLLRFPEIVEILETISKSENIQVILVSQLIDHFSKIMLKEFPIRLIGRTSASQIQSIKKTLQCSEIIRRCTKFANPRKQNYSYWMLDQGEGVPGLERFQFYQHDPEQFAA